MEPIGLAVGIAGLAGLFSSCLDVIEKADSYKTFGVESRAIIAHFEADKLLFRKWAQNVGIHQGKLKETHHRDLDDPETARMIGKILSSIQETFGNTENTLSKLQYVSATGSTSSQENALFSQETVLNQKFQGSVSTSRRIEWALKSKAKFIAQVQQFGTLVQKLHSLVPPGVAKRAVNVSPGMTSDFGNSSIENYALDASRFSDSQRVLNDFWKQIKVDAKKEIDGWLSATWTNNLYDNFLRRRLDSTCDWILDCPAFLEWVSSDFPSNTAKMLWVNGPAGYGKTIVCARAVQYLSATLKSPLASYFFSSESGNAGDPFVIIRSWLSQVIACNQNAFELACERWEKKEGYTASRTDIMELFRLVVLTIPNCTFVVDGLDECAWLNLSWKITDDDSPMGFLTSLKHAIAQTTSRVMIVSRDEVSIRSGIHTTLAHDPNQTLYEHTISQDDVQSDVEIFSRSIVDRKLANKDETLRDKLSRKIVERCNGMFLWVKMQEDNLRGGKSTRQLEEIVDNAPTKLDRLYDRNWMRINNLPAYDRARAFSILRWAAFALRPLTILELTEALLVKDDDSCKDIPFDEFPDDIDDDYVNGEIIGLCGSLVEIQGAASKQSLASMTVHLTHFSVKQYILYNLVTPELTHKSELSLSNEAIQCNKLAKVCLRYINFQNVWQEPILSENSVASRPFRDYAAKSWHQHATATGKNYPEVVGLINTIFHPTNTNWESWRKWFDNTDWPSTGSDQSNGVISASPLYYASLLGLHDTVTYLLGESELDPNCIGGSHQLAIQAACTMGHLLITKLLLESGADITAANNDGRTLLYLASNNGHVEIAKLLLEQGADLTVTSNNGWTPLNSASSNGHVTIVKLLLEQGADLTVTSNNGWTPLNSASSNGHVEIVKLLLEQKADLTVTSDNGWTPLNSASNNGYVEVVKLLLEQGADLTVANNNKWTPLNSASSNGHVEVVNLLLKQGADLTVTNNCGRTPLNVANNYGRTPLNSASTNGHVEVVKLLLEQGADLTAASDNEWTPLNSASNNGHVEVVKLLLEQGADLTAANNYGWTPLNSASNNGHVEVVKLLLEQVADLTVTNNYGWTPLNSASYNGHVEVVKLLLEQGADLTAASDDEWTPLNSASNNGYVEVVKLLLEQGADLTVTDNYERTPLNLASNNGHVEVVKLLLERGADLTVTDSYEWTPLNSASNNGHVKVIKLLLEQGADLTVGNNCGWTPLHSASSNGYDEVIKLFFEKGADFTVPNKARCSAIVAAAEEGHEPIINLLIDYGAIAKLTRSSLSDLLFAMAYGGCLASLRLLIKRHLVDYDEIDAQGRNAAHFAARGGQIDVLEYLLAMGINASATDVQKNGLLHYAASGASVDMVRKTIPYYTAVLASCNTWTPLHWAYRNGDAAVVNLLLEAGLFESVVTTTEPIGQWTPYAIAVFHQNKNLIRGSVEDARLDETPSVRQPCPSTVDLESPISSIPSQLSGSPQLTCGPLGTKSVAARKHESYYCDGCRHGIFGLRFHCLSCADFDYCFMCKLTAHLTHPSHKWEVVSLEDQLVAPTL